MLTIQIRMVQCLLCFEKMASSEVADHLRHIHRIDASVIFNHKPLKRWCKPLQS